VKERRGAGTYLHESKGEDAMLHKVLTTVALATILALVLLALPGCPKSDSCPGLQNGKVYEVELAVTADGLFALEAETAGADDDCEQEGENEGENEGCDDEGDEAELTAQVTDIAADRSTFELLGALTVMVEPGAEVEISIDGMEIGDWVEVEGALGTDGLFHATELEAAGEHETELQAVLQDLTDSTFTMIGLTITYDDTLEMECEDDDHDDDDDDDDEDDEEDDD
jgi:hypothetical protein